MVCEPILVFAARPGGQAAPRSQQNWLRTYHAFPGLTAHPTHGYPNTTPNLLKRRWLWRQWWRKRAWRGRCAIAPCRHAAKMSAHAPRSTCATGRAVGRVLPVCRAGWLGRRSKPREHRRCAQLLWRGGRALDPALREMSLHHKMGLPDEQNETSTTTMQLPTDRGFLVPYVALK